MKLIWDKSGERFFETGVDHGVLYPWDSTANSGAGGYTPGVAWNGLTAVNESPSGAEATALWADNIKYLELRSAEEFGGTIEAYTYPDEFMECDGTAKVGAHGVFLGQQPRKKFGLCYRTRVGNDEDGETKGYKLHLVYGATASPSEKAYNTINDSPEAITFSWTFTTVPVDVSALLAGAKPTSIITIDSTKTDSTKLGAVENLLYGDLYLPRSYRFDHIQPCQKYHRDLNLLNNLKW